MKFTIGKKNEWPGEKEKAKREAGANHNNQRACEAPYRQPLQTVQGVCFITYGGKTHCGPTPQLTHVPDYHSIHSSMGGHVYYWSPLSSSTSSFPLAAGEIISHRPDATLNVSPVNRRASIHADPPNLFLETKSRGFEDDRLLGQHQWNHDFDFVTNSPSGDLWPLPLLTSAGGTIHTNTMCHGLQNQLSGAAEHSQSDAFNQLVGER